MHGQHQPDSPHIVIIGGGPAGLMAAEAAARANCAVTLIDQCSSVGRKILIAGKGGLNLTHSEAFDDFCARYGQAQPQVRAWLQDFDAQAVRAWAQELGVATIIGSSGRVFPHDLKAAPLLRAWLRRLRAQGVRFVLKHRCVAVQSSARAVTVDCVDAGGAHHRLTADAAVLALGGASWAKLGSDGRWPQWLAVPPEAIAPWQPSNCGFEVAWSDYLRQRHAGSPIQNVVLHWRARDGQPRQKHGEISLSDYGIEGSAVYAASADLRDAIARDGHCTLTLDLLPQLSAREVTNALSRARGKRSLTEHLRRSVHIHGARAALLFEVLPAAQQQDLPTLARTLKALPLTLLRARALDEAISSAGGLKLDAVNENLMLRAQVGVFAAGEMLDWEAPTGGYLLTACFASGLRAGRAAAAYARASMASTSG
ncbi:TIGR03862 family flavoprotein [Sinimarinibacterium sp. NLF-5-8]|uniref:TIGR03862 family flavoprotein n=1 Tax=Sinimarinibacterium sp. NLF-5-8 TaxID=2698684 RepID=UPI00137C3CD1|nr:TIGR03862 family flavoprotein [Sinimarinibacterium sp. NLF-5-8]QHS11049.1 TIGR03862 family flavoprotein [Sinimarinibacterium sp. NLF-5-8]